MADYKVESLEELILKHPCVLIGSSAEVGEDQYVFSPTDKNTLEWVKVEKTVTKQHPVREYEHAFDLGDEEAFKIFKELLPLFFPNKSIQEALGELLDGHRHTCDEFNHEVGELGHPYEWDGAVSSVDGCVLKQLRILAVSKGLLEK